MSDRSAIEWTDATWNPVRGCTKVSAGCKHCYAERFAERFRGVKGHPFEQGFDVRLVPEQLELPEHWRKPRRVFVNSMSDLFHEAVPDAFIDRVFDVMERTCTWRSEALAYSRPGHVFQVLTKRADRMVAYVRRRLDAKKRYANGFKKCPTAAMRDSPAAREAREDAVRVRAGIWLGVSVEDQRAVDERIPSLLTTPAEVRFLSCEPLLGPVDLRGLLVHPCGESVDWVIVGGESGPGARPCDVAWLRSLVQQCKAAGVPVFVKQLGACASDPPSGLAGAALRVPDEAAALISRRLRDRKGGDPSEWPPDLRLRQIPGGQD